MTVYIQPQKINTIVYSIVWVILLSTNICGYSQSNYPKKIVYHGDTCILITSEQLIKINHKLQLKNYLKQQNHNLILLNESLLHINDKKDSVIVDQKNLLETYDRAMVNNLTDIKSLQSQNDDLKERLDKKKKTCSFLIGAAALLSFIIGTSL